MPSISYLGEFEQMVLLAILQGGDEANALQIRRELEASANRSVSKGAFYTTLDRMEKKGWVTRRRCTEDRRRVWCNITPDGLTLINSLDRPIEGIDDVFASALEPHEVEQLVSYLDRLRSEMNLPKE